MSELREQIYAEVQRAGFKSWDYGCDGTSNLTDYGAATDRIIALVTEALLSEEAVEAVYLGLVDPDTGLGDRDFDESTCGLVISNSLAAAGLTTGGSDHE